MNDALATDVIVDRLYDDEKQARIYGMLSAKNKYLSESFPNAYLSRFIDLAYPDSAFSTSLIDGSISHGPKSVT